MSLVPAFDIGVWNAWIFILINFLPMPILMLTNKEGMQEAMKADSDIERKLYGPGWILWFAACIYSIFLPMRLGRCGSMWVYP